MALHAVSLTPLERDGSALVVGAGTIGLLILQALRASGCERVFVADIDRTRLEVAKKMGATEIFFAGRGGFRSRKLCGARAAAGVDAAIEAVGRNETVAAAIDSVRKGGAVTLVGNTSPEVTLPLQKVVTRQIRLQGSCASAGEYPRAMELSGQRGDGREVADHGRWRRSKKGRVV